MIRRMHSGEIYDCTDERLQKEQQLRTDKLLEYNNLSHTEPEKRTALLKENFKEFGEGSYIEAPFFANWCGKFVSFGKGVYANFNLTMIDDGEITVGDHVMFGPNVTLVTAAHPISPTLREKQIQYNEPVVIGRNVWIGAGAIILPGVTIGENSVIGAGSVVTRDIPANVVAVGNPCRVMREITEEDYKTYAHGSKKIEF